jgi:hypothetical protein
MHPKPAEQLACGQHIDASRRSRWEIDPPAMWRAVLERGVLRVTCSMNDANPACPLVLRRRTGHTRDALPHCERGASCCRTCRCSRSAAAAASNSRDSAHRPRADAGSAGGRNAVLERRWTSQAGPTQSASQWHAPAAQEPCSPHARSAAQASPDPAAPDAASKWTRLSGHSGGAPSEGQADRAAGAAPSSR